MIIPIKFDGKKATVELDEELDFGTVQDVVDANAGINDATGRMDVNLSGYGTGITVAAIKTAPWKVGDVLVLRTLPWKVALKVIGEANKLYPLETLLSAWAPTIQQ